jgi:DNA-binding PadR family transcriptional regulator
MKNQHSNQAVPDDLSSDVASGPSRRRHRMHRHQHIHFAEHTRGGPRHRARRGAAALAVLTLLDERPMHGYELIGELDARSGGRWRPSSGTIYPALSKLEHRGLITSSEVDGKQQYSLTDDGRTVVAKMHRDRTDDEPAPWDDRPTGSRGDLRGHLAELAGQARQIGRFGTAEQIERAGAVLNTAKRSLYAILAEEPKADMPADVPADGSPDASVALDTSVQEVD